MDPYAVSITKEGERETDSQQYKSKMLFRMKGTLLTKGSCDFYELACVSVTNMCRYGQSLLTMTLSP
jgi:hypothetical protein